MYRALFPLSLLAALAGGLVLVPTTRAAEVGYVEDFALSQDRAAALKQLIPGTEDYYYYHALHALNTGRLDAVDGLVRPWVARHGRTPRVIEIEVRHALLAYDKDPKTSVDWLVSHLGLRFDHQRENVNAVPDLPTALDQTLIGRDALKAGSFGRWTNLENFEDAALDWLAGEKLTCERRRTLLQR